MPNFVTKVKTVSTVDYLPALAQNAGANANITLAGALAGVNGNSRVRLKNISIISVENLSWEIWFFTANTFQTTIDADTFLGFWSFAASDAKRIAATGLYYYYVEDLDVPYLDTDNTGKLHMTLVNRSAASKTANAGGAITIKVTAEIEGA